MDDPRDYELPDGMTPEREQELVFRSLPRRYRRKMKKFKKVEPEWPDVTKGMSNHQKMLLKKIGRGGVESHGRARRNKSK
jgi:hypothetical protein